MTMSVRLPNVWVEDRHFTAGGDHRCSVPGCTEPAVAFHARPIGAGRARRAWRCEHHLARIGRRVRDGRVECGVYPGSPADARGYIDWPLR